MEEVEVAVEEVAMEVTEVEDVEVKVAVEKVEEVTMEDVAVRVAPGHCSCSCNPQTCS